MKIHVRNFHASSCGRRNGQDPISRSDFTALDFSDASFADRRSAAARARNRVLSCAPFCAIRGVLPGNAELATFVSSPSCS